MIDCTGYFDMMSWKLILALVLTCIIRAYLKGAQFRERASCKGLVAVVTGCSGGIGKQVVRELNGRGARVHMLCRDLTRADAALAHLVQEGCDSSRLLLHHVDLASFASIRKFAEEFFGAETKVDILVNNAGIVNNKFKLTEDGHELTWQTNYLGHFLLTELLLHALRAAAGGRVVNVSSVAHFYADSLDVDAVDLRDHFDLRQPYARSKLAQVMHVRELTRRLRRAGAHTTTANACHPGLVYTRILRNTPLGTNRLLAAVVAPFAWFLLKTAKDGAQTPVHLSLSAALASVSGSYFAEMTERQPSPAALDDRACTDLYERSLAICALDASAADGPVDAADAPVAFHDEQNGEILPGRPAAACATAAKATRLATSACFGAPCGVFAAGQVRRWVQPCDRVTAARHVDTARIAVWQYATFGSVTRRAIMLDSPEQLTRQAPPVELGRCPRCGVRVRPTCNASACEAGGKAPCHSGYSATLVAGHPAAIGECE